MPGELRRSEENILSIKGYKLVKKIGCGTYGTVFLTEYTDPESNNTKHLACKIIDKEKAPKEYINKFLPRELEIMTQVNHPYIVFIQGILQRKSKYFVFMRYAEVGDLLGFILNKGALSEVQSRLWLRQIALAVQYLHTMEISHRDLKCENALLSCHFNIKLADFGFARYTVDTDGKAIKSETYCGSLSYVAPEVLKRKPYYPKKSDLWSIGVILYVMLNKSMPFQETNIKRLIELQTHKRWHFRGRLVNVLSSHVKKVIENLLEPNPDQRWTLNNLLKSVWIQNDERLQKLHSTEKHALAAAQKEKSSFMDTNTSESFHNKLKINVRIDEGSMIFKQPSHVSEISRLLMKDESVSNISFNNEEPILKGLYVFILLKLYQFCDYLKCLL